MGVAATRETTLRRATMENFMMNVDCFFSRVRRNFDCKGLRYAGRQLGCIYIGGWARLLGVMQDASSDKLSRAQLVPQAKTDEVISKLNSVVLSQVKMCNGFVSDQRHLDARAESGDPRGSLNELSL